MLVRLMFLVIPGLVLLAGSAQPATPTTSNCEAYLLTASAKYAQCRLKAIATATKNGTTPDYAKCDPKLQIQTSPTNLAKKCAVTLDPAFPTTLQEFITGAADGAQLLIAGGAAGQPPIAISCETSTTTTTVSPSTTSTTNRPLEGCGAGCGFFDPCVGSLVCTADTNGVCVCPGPGEICSAGICTCVSDSNCLPGHNCVNGHCCILTTCAAQSANCGSIPDGCGGTLDCGTCTPPASCGGAGVPYQCGVFL